jgi:cytochrome c-type biogenesis protein CcmH
MKKLIWITLIVVALAAVWTGMAAAQQPTPSDDQVNAVAHQLYCPVCENTPLDVCPTQACAQWRELIRQKLAEGWSQDQIKQYFVENYGARVLAEPPRQGLNWLAYIIPPVIILVGAFVLFRALRAWTQPAMRDSAPAESETPAKKSEDDYVARFEEELRKHK